MKLHDLEPRFYRVRREQATWIEIRNGVDVQVNGLRTVLPHAEGLADAQGVEFLCPACFAKNGGPVGTHGILVWFKDKGVPDDLTPGPGRWAASGTVIEDLTLKPSVDLSKHATDKSCVWHGFVTNGETSNV